MTAADFKYSLERAADPRLAGAQPPASLPAGIYLDDIVGVSDKLAGKATQITGVQAPDPYTLVLTIDAPKQYFLAKLTAGPAYVLEQSNVNVAEEFIQMILAQRSYEANSRVVQAADQMFQTVNALGR